MTHNNWPTVKLGNLITRAKRQTAGSKEYPVLSMTMEHGMVLQKERFKKRIAGKNTDKYKVVENGQLVVGFPIDEGVLDFQTLVQAGIVSPAYKIWELKDSSVCNLNYLRRYLRSNIAISYYRARLQGTTARRRSLTDQAFLQLPVPLPPLEEQRRIAGLLDKAVANLDNSRKSLKALNTFLPNLFESSFNSGNRTITSIGSYLAQTQYGTSTKAGESGTFPILRMGNITSEGQIDFSDLKFIDLDPSEFVKYTLKTGDILFNRTNSKDLVGKTAVYYGEEGSFAYAGYLVRCRANSNSTPEYISGYLNSPTGKAVLRNAAKSIVGMANINAKELQRLPIPEADPVEQRQWAEFEQEIHNLSGKLKKQVTLHHELYESLSARAFTGEL